MLVHSVDQRAAGKPEKSSRMSAIPFRLLQRKPDQRSFDRLHVCSGIRNDDGHSVFGGSVREADRYRRVLCAPGRRGLHVASSGQAQYQHRACGRCTISVQYEEFQRSPRSMRRSICVRESDGCVKTDSARRRVLRRTRRLAVRRGILWNFARPERNPANCQGGRTPAEQRCREQLEATVARHAVCEVAPSLPINSLMTRAAVVMTTLSLVGARSIHGPPPLVLRL